MSTYHLVPNSIEGNAERGGWIATGSIFNDQSDAEYSKNVVLRVHPEGGGSWLGYTKVAMNGSLIPESLNFDRGSSEIPFSLNTSDIFLQNAGLQGLYLIDDATPTNIHEITDLNLGKIVEHIVEGHANVSTDTPGGWVDTSGIDTTNSTPVNVYSVKSSNSAWSTVKNIASNEFYVAYFTKEDKLIYEPHPQFAVTPNDSIMTLTHEYLIERPEVIFRDRIQTDQVQLYALTDDGDILQSFFPALVGTEGRRNKIANLRCNSQARLDTLAERQYDFLNRDIDVRVTIPGPWGVFMELYDRIGIIYAGTARNGVDINWSDKKFYINTITVDKNGNFGAVTGLSLTEEVL